MSPRRSTRASKGTSPSKPSGEEKGLKSLNGTDSKDTSPSKRPKAVTAAVPALKLRFSAATVASAAASKKDVDLSERVEIVEPKPMVPKLKLKLSTSGSSSSAPSASASTESVGEGKARRGRGRPRVNRPVEASVDEDHFETEAEGAKRRRRAGHEGAAAPNGTEQDEIDVLKPRRLRRARDDALLLAGSHETVDELAKEERRRIRKQQQKYELERQIPRATHTTPPETSSTLTPVLPSVIVTLQENELIQRTKAALNIATQHDSFLYSSTTSTPFQSAFKSLGEAVESLSAFHLALNAGFYHEQHLVENRAPSEHVSGLNDLAARLQASIHASSSKKVPSELLLLEQKLCLEEEKFLLVKLKNEYYARFGAGSAGTSRPTTPALSRTGSVSGSYESLPR